MKKLLTGLMVATIMSGAVGSVVACGGGGIDTSEITGKKIWLVTDAGKINDKSFNESGFNGANYFNRNMLGIEQNINITEPTDLSGELINAYTNAKFEGAGTLILPGFHHAVEGGNQAADIMNGGTTIILDSDDGGKANQIGIMFRGDVSGFYAGLSSLIQLSNTEGAPKDVKLSTFGGAHNAGAVDNFMVGYLASIEFFNKAVKEETIKTALGIGEHVTSASRIKDQENGPTSDTDSKWFTGSFIGGDGQTISESHFNSTNNSTILMPVAGGQTVDALKAAKKANQFVVGVDTDQSTQYTDPVYKDKFMTSAEKALVESTVVSLGHSKLYVNEKDVQDKTLQYAKDNSATFTYEDETGKFVDYDLETNKAETWEGKTLWMGGKASSGGTNKVTSTTLDKMLTVLGDSAIAASTTLFETIATDASAKNVLSNETITAYATSIWNAINKKL